MRRDDNVGDVGLPRLLVVGELLIHRLVDGLTGANDGGGPDLQSGHALAFEHLETGDHLVALALRPRVPRSAEHVVAPRLSLDAVGAHISLCQEDVVGEEDRRAARGALVELDVGVQQEGVVVDLAVRLASVEEDAGPLVVAVRARPVVQGDVVAHDGVGGQAPAAAEQHEAALVLMRQVVLEEVARGAVVGIEGGAVPRAVNHPGLEDVVGAERHVVGVPGPDGGVVAIVGLAAVHVGDVPHRVVGDDRTLGELVHDGVTAHVGDLVVVDLQCTPRVEGVAADAAAHGVARAEVGADVDARAVDVLDDVVGDLDAVKSRGGLGGASVGLELDSA